MKKHISTAQLVFAATATLVYTACLYIFLQNQVFEHVWLLYLGNLLFGLVTGAFVLREIFYLNKLQPSLQTVVSAHLVTLMAIIMAAATAWMLLAVMMPGYFTGLVQTAAPGERFVQEMENNYTNLTLTVFLNLAIGNFTAASFISILVTYAANYKGEMDRERPYLKHQNSH